MLTNTFWSRVDRTNEPDACWVWTGPTGPRGFGIATDPRRRNAPGTLAHIAAWRLDGRPAVPPGGALLHRCGNRTCVRPDHLEPVGPRPRQWRSRGRRWSVEAPAILAAIAAWEPAAAAVPLPAAAGLVGLTEASLRRAITAGELPAPPGRSRRIRMIPREDLVAFVAGRAAEDSDVDA